MKFSGRIADFSLPDTLRILIQSSKQGYLKVRHYDQESRIFINRGELQHAESDGLKGEQAVYNMFNFGPTAEFEFVEDDQAPLKTIHSDLDTLIQNGITYLDTWRKISKRYPRLNIKTELIGLAHTSQLTKEETYLYQLISQEQRASLYEVIEIAQIEPTQLVDALVLLEQKHCIHIFADKSMEIRQFFLETANTLLQEFNSISGLKLKQETNEKLEKLIQEKNWKIEIQNGRIVDDKMHSSSLQEQTELYSLYLNHLVKMITPIYGKPFLQQVMNKVEQELSGSVQHWVKELNLEL